MEVWTRWPLGRLRTALRRLAPALILSPSPAAARPGPYAPLVALAAVVLLAVACSEGAPGGGRPAIARDPNSALTPQPAFAMPREDRIAFVSLSSGLAEIHTIRPDGSGLLNLSGRATPSNSYPAWSPDGSRV